MNKFLALLVTLCLSLSCKKDAEVKRGFNPVYKVGMQEKPVSSPKGLGRFMDCDNDVFWTAKQNDSSKYWVRLVFEKDFATYQFHGQCLYFFFTNYQYTGADKVHLLWSYKSDCLLDMDFISQTHNVKRYPKHGDEFSEYQLLNDSVIVVKYHFPEWTNEVNRIAKDSVFPKYFYLEDEPK